MKKILIYASGNLTHGARLHIYQSIKALLLSDDYKVTVILSKPLYLSNIFPGITEVTLFFDRSKVFGLFTIFILIPIFSKLKKYDAVYFPWGICPHLSSSTVILGVHHPALLFEKPIQSFRSRFFSMLLKRSLVNSDVVKFPSLSFSNFVTNTYPVCANKSIVVKHGVDINSWCEKINKTEILINQNKYFIFWSWFHITKNIENLIDSFSIYCKKSNRVPYSLVLAGTWTDKICY